MIQNRDIVQYLETKECLNHIDAFVLVFAPTFQLDLCNGSNRGQIRSGSNKSGSSRMQIKIEWAQMGRAISVLPARPDPFINFFLKISIEISISN